MKRVINGLTYNTETATEIAFVGSNLSMSDFRYKEETLYITKNKRFFIAGEGHGMTRWATNNGNSSGWGEGIEPLCPETALMWCEQNNIDADLIAEYFNIEEA